MNKLYNGDCLEVMQKLIDDGVKVDMILTDPPYALGQFMKTRSYNMKNMRNNHIGEAYWDNMDINDWDNLIENFISKSAVLLKKGGALISFMESKKINSFMNFANSTELYFKTIGVWHKTNPIPRNMNLHFVDSIEMWLYYVNRDKTGKFNNNKIIKHNFIETSITGQSEKKLGKHQTQKPVKLMKHFIELLSNESDVILDPFMGSGSTGVACLNTNRDFIGIELDKGYFDIASRRIEDVKSELENRLF